MKLFIFLAAASSVFAGIVDDDHERPTSYQNIHIEHFHPIPTFIKKEHKELLEHPVSLGTTSSKVEIHHGGKHDHGYAFANAEHNIHGHAFGGEFEALAGDAGAYQVQDYAQYEGHLGHAAALGHYQLGAGAQEGGLGHEEGGLGHYGGHDSA